MRSDSSAATAQPSSLTLVNGLPPVTTPTTTPTIPTTKKSTMTTASDTTDDPPPSVIDRLKAGLIAAGIDISGMQFTEHRDLETYPGGSYVNDMISLKTSTGQSHEYMTDLVAIAPQVTVTEIQQLLLGHRG